MEFLTRPQPEILKNWKEQNYEEIAAASQPFQSGNTLSQ
jgi:hypothetical protein